MDPYPWNGALSDNLTKAVAEFDFLMDALKGRADRAAVCVTQYFGWQNYLGQANKTLPPAAAMRAMAFAAIATGCRGVILYS